MPFFLQWPGQIPAGTVFEHPVNTLDVLPTALAAAGATPQDDPLFEGRDLVPYLRDPGKGAPHESLFWRFGEQRAVRHGDWKLLVSKKGDGAAELYNLRNDIGEQHNLAASEPDRASELQALYDAWNAKNIAPLWGNKTQNAAR